MKKSNFRKTQAPNRIGIRLIIGATIFILAAATVFVTGFAQESERASAPSQASRINLLDRQTPAAMTESGDGMLRERREPATTEAQATDDAPSVAAPETILAAATSANYTFTTNTNGTFTDMSSGTSLLVSNLADDSASSVRPIGFDFYLMGVRYTQFSATSNGLVGLGSTAAGAATYTVSTGTATTPIISAFGSDLNTGAAGKVHYKVTGTAPNRVLTIEFLNMSLLFNASATNDGTYQVRLYETTGKVEFVYGAMSRNAGTGAFVSTVGIGFSVNTTANNFVSIVSATNTANTSPSFTTNTYTAGSGAIPNLNSPVEGSRRVYALTPPTPTAPTNLTFTGVTSSSMTLNWTDSPNETIYGIYLSTDGVNFNGLGTVAMDSTSVNITGLRPGTNYTWQVAAVSEGALNSVQGSQATNAAGNILSTPAGGLWSATTTWVGGVVPTAGDNVTIVDGATVTVDTTAAANSLTVGSTGVSGILQYQDTATARSLTVSGSVTINTGATIRANNAATVSGTTHTLSVGQDLINSGTLNLSITTGSFTSGVQLIFFGATDAAFTLNAGSTTNLRQTTGLTLNKGNSSSTVLTFTPGGTFTVQGSATTGFLAIANGTFKIAGTGTFSNNVWSVVGPTIPFTGGIWLNDPNFTVTAQNGTHNLFGLFRLDNGTYNLGTAQGNRLGFNGGSTVVINGGAYNGASRFSPSSAGVSYTQTGGTFTVNTVSNTSTANSSFDITTSSDTFTMTGGTIVTRLAGTGASGPRDYRNFATPNITGGTLQLGDASSGAAQTFNIQGAAPNVIISNASANHSAQQQGETDVYLNTTISPGTTLNLNAFLYLQLGTNFFNNGTLTGTTAGSRLYFFSLTNAAQLYGGSGVVTASLASLDIDNPGGVTIQAGTVNNIITSRVDLFRGTITNSNKVQLGNGGATSAVTQIGVAGGTSPGGNYDQSPTFNIGTGGYGLFYLQESTPRTTGFEIPATRTITTMQVDNTNNVTLAGGDLAVSSAAAALTLSNGRFITGANTLSLTSGTATVTRTNGYVDGNFNKTFAAIGSKTYEVGTANGYSPFTANVTAGTFPSSLTAKAVQGPQPTLDPTKSLQRYWTLTEIGDLTADLTFQYLDPTDIAGNEANYRVVKVESGMASNLLPPQATVNTAANTATVTGVSSFSDWTVAEPLAPTAGTANISGRITTGAGAPLSGVTMTLLDTVTIENRIAVTDANGLYQFGAITTGRDFVVTPTRDGYSFNPASSAFSHTGERTNVNFIATPDSTQLHHVANDFDGDGKTDLAVFRPADATWYILNSSNGAMRSEQFGLDTDRIVPADYDGDGKTDVAVFRPSTGAWYIYQSATNSLRGVQWGVETDIAVPADYDGDGKADLAVFRPSTGTWYVLESTTGNLNAVNWGTTGDRPVAADYDGDGRADVAVWRPSTATFYIINSSNNQNRFEHWGVETDHVVVGDYDGDGKADLAVFRADNTTWYVKLSTDGSITSQSHGTAQDRLVPGDYDGDGRTDRAVWQQAEGNWLILRSTTNASTNQKWGANGDVPAPAAYIQ